MTSSEGYVKPAAMPGVHEYGGIHFPPFIAASNLKAMETWQVRSDDIFIVTYPKAGTHWMFEIVSLIVNGGDPSKIERGHMDKAPELSLGNPMDLEGLKSAPSGYKLLESLPSPRIMGTHLHEQFFPPDAMKKKVKMIYVARNPKDLFCSLESFSRPIQTAPELRDFDNFIKYRLLCDEVPMGSWFDHVKGYAKHHNEDNFLYVRYEDLHKDLLGEVKKIAQFLGRPVTDDVAETIATFSTFDGMQKTYDQHEKDNPAGIMHTRAFGKLKYLNKGKVGSWKEKITGDLNDFFDKVYEEKMADSGLEFDFEI